MILTQITVCRGGAIKNRFSQIIFERFFVKHHSAWTNGSILMRVAAIAFRFHALAIGHLKIKHRTHKSRDIKGFVTFWFFFLALRKQSGELSNNKISTIFGVTQLLFVSIEIEDPVFANFGDLRMVFASLLLPNCTLMMLSSI